MRPEVRNTLILVLVFAALLTGWWLLETYQPGSQPETTPEGDKYIFPTLSIDDVEGVQVTLSAGESMYAFKGPSAWYLGGLGGEFLNGSVVESGVSGIVGLRAQRTFTEDIIPAEFGLDAPTATVKLVLTNNRVTSLLVGDVNPEGYSYYVQRVDSPAVYLVSRYAIDTVLAWPGTPPLEPTPTPAAVQTVVATGTPMPTTAPGSPTLPPATPTHTATPAGTVITVVVTPTPVPTATPVMTPTVTISPTVTTGP